MIHRERVSRQQAISPAAGRTWRTGSCCFFLRAARTLACLALPVLAMGGCEKPKPLPPSDPNAGAPGDGGLVADPNGSSRLEQIDPVDPVDRTPVKAVDVPRDPVKRWSMLLSAAQTNDLDEARALVDAGMNLDRGPTSAKRRDAVPLAIAIDEGSWDVAVVLVRGGADMTAATKEGPCVHRLMVDDLGATRVLREMIRRGVDVNLPDKQGQTPLLVLMDAPFTGARRRLAEMLLKAGADINVHGKRGMAPLHLAVAREDSAAVRFLLDHDADPDVKMNGGHTPLHLAAMRDLVNIARALIDAGADIRAKNDELDTPFLTAHFSQAPEVKALLEKHGGN